MPKRPQRIGKSLLRSRIGIKLSLLSAFAIVFAGAGVFVVLRSQAATCSVDAKLVNPCRPWLGAAVGKYPQVASDRKSQTLYHEQRIGKQLDIEHTYHTNDFAFTSDETYFLNRGTYVFADWKPTTGTWGPAGGTNASINARIDAAANTIKSIAPKKIFLTLHHEPENDISGGATDCPASVYVGSSGTPTEYRAMWQNVRNRFNAKGVSNVIWVVDYMNYAPYVCMIDDLYPGDNLVDWVMFNAYGGPTQQNYEKNVNDAYSYFTANSSAQHNYLSKPWGIVEWNIRNATEAQGISYYDQAKAALDANRFPKLKAYMIFDSIGPEGNENRVAYTNAGVYSTAKMDHYSAFANDPEFSRTTLPATPTPSPNPTVTPQPTPVSTATPGPTPTAGPGAPQSTTTPPSPPSDLPPAPGSGNPLEITPEGSGSPVTVPVNAVPTISGTIKLEQPGLPASQTTIKVDGHTVASGGRLDTTYLTNGNHVVTVETAGSGGKVVASRNVVVDNRLAWWQIVRNFIFTPFHGNKVAVNIATIALATLVSAIAGFFGFRYWKYLHSIAYISNLR